MNTFSHQSRRGAIRLVLLWSILNLAVAPISFSQTNGQSSSTPSITPDQLLETQSRPPKPLSRMSKLGVAAAVMLVSLIVLLFSIRAWRAGNLFDREYRLPPLASVAIRLGGNRSGGCMATINFRDRPDMITTAASRREDS
jgi:hypothetical protein